MGITETNNILNPFFAAGAVDTKNYTFDDWIAGAAAGSIGWTTDATGAGASAQMISTDQNGTERALGVVQLDTGGTANGRATLHLGTESISFGYAQFTQSWRMRVEQLSILAQRFETTFGYIDDPNSVLFHTDGVYFQYEDTLGANWRAVCSTLGVNTVVDTGIVVQVAAMDTFKIIVNEAASLASFFINNALVASIATNIPTSPNFCGPGLKIRKSLGAAPVSMLFDYYEQLILFSSQR